MEIRDQQLQPRAQLCVVGELQLHELLGAREDVLRRVGRARTLAQQVAHELVGGLGEGELLQRAVALEGGLARLPQRRARAREQREHDRARGAHRERIALHEASEPVAEGVGARRHRATLEHATQIVGERLYRRITRGDVLLERLGEHRVEIAANRPRAPARRHDLDAQDRFLERRGALVAQAVRPLAGQQFVEHDGERVDVARHAQRLAADLLGRGVVARVGAADELRQRRLAGPLPRFVIQQLGHTEVEQPHLAVGGDEDVARLEVAMDDQPRVRMCDRLGNLQEQAQALRHGQRVRGAVGVDRLRRRRAPSPARGGRRRSCRRRRAARCADARAWPGCRARAPCAAPGRGSSRARGSLSATRRCRLPSLRSASHTVDMPP